MTFSVIQYFEELNDSILNIIIYYKRDENMIFLFVVFN